MKVLTAAALLLALGLEVADAERKYKDDLGITHTTTIEKPTIVTFAHTAVSLFDYGLGTDQLIGTYGEYVVSGSDFNFDQPEQASSYSADPEPEDIAKLLTTTNLSPECERTPGYCTSFDIDTLVALDPDYLIVHGYADSPWGFTNFTEVEVAFPKTKIIYNDVSLKGDDCSATENCYGKSMIDVIEQYIELAVFLNLEEPSKLQEDMAALCAAATEFSGHMETVHGKGIRTMAAYVDPSMAFYASPINDMVLRMFEELGMPILHTGKCEDCSMSYYWETIPSESFFASCTDAQSNATEFIDCNGDPLYPVDVWLYDHRTRATINTEDFAIVFPDKAILEGQFVEWPIGGRKITPTHAAEILNSVGPSLAGFNQIHPSTDCVSEVDVSSHGHRQSGEGIKGAGAGNYACYNTGYHNSKYFYGCSTTEEGAEGNPGACYDMVAHECGCDADRCSAEKCAAVSGIWTAECPDHCTECDEAADGNPGACYDMVTHECGCGADRCSAELCAAASGIWSAECPDHCTECDESAAPLAEQEENGDHDGEEHSSHDEEDHSSHSHSHDEMDENMAESSAKGHSIFSGMAMAALFAVLSL